MPRSTAYPYAGAPVRLSFAAVTRTPRQRGPGEADAAEIVASAPGFGGAAGFLLGEREDLVDDQLAGSAAGVPVGVDAQAPGQHGAHLGAGEQRVAGVDVACQVVGDEFQAAALAVEQLRAADDEAVAGPPGVADAVGQADVGG